MSSRLSRGRSTPAIRATVPSLLTCSGPLREARSRGPTLEASSTLSLLVSWVRADDEDAPTPTDHAALVADPLHRRTDFHRRLPLLVPVHHTASCEVVRRQLHQDPISRQDPDVVHPHLAGDVGQHQMIVVQLHSEHGVRQRLDDRPLDLDRVFLRHAPDDSFERVPPRLPTSANRSEKGGPEVYGWLVSYVHVDGSRAVSRGP